ncbi:recombinase XerD [Staphylococcus felis]|uniref:Recombinase XerD n=1 Tax=Staphylococcus felis TaxID=46127 RepID=A0A3E0INZ8_9STAP|nr:recombinase XerD [Staphylococcus felis]
MKKRARNIELSSVELDLLRGLFDKENKVNQIKKVKFDELITQFISKCVARGLSESTIIFYESELKVFRYFLVDCLPELLDNFLGLNADDIENYKHYLIHVRGAKKGNVNSKLKALKTFIRSTPLKNSVGSQIEFMRDEKYKVNAFTTKQVKALLKQPNKRTYTGFRDYIIMMLLLDTGIRSRELVELKTNNLNTIDKNIFINKAKNGLSRVVPISDKVMYLLEVLLDLNNQKEYIFQTIQGSKLNRETVYKKLKRYGELAGINKEARVSAHTFRHTFAKLSIQNGANIFELQKILGHQTLDMVRVYVNLYDSEINKAHEKFSPTKNF